MKNTNKEITLVMVEAGIKALEAETPEHNIPCKDDIVTAVFEAMDAARQAAQ